MRDNNLLSHNFKTAPTHTHALDEKSVKWYIKPVVLWLGGEWELFKKRLLKQIETIAIRLDEAIEFTPSNRLKILDAMDNSIGLMQIELANRIAAQKRLVQVDAGSRLGQAGQTTVAISEQDLQQVLTGLDDQVENMETTTSTIRRKVDLTLQARYGSPALLSTEIKRLLRINRDDIRNAAQQQYGTIAESYRVGNITSERFRQRMLERIRVDYRKSFRDGKGIPLTDSDLTFIDTQVSSQEQYIDNLINATEAERLDDKGLTKVVNRRATLFANRSTALYEAGRLTNYPDDTLIDWMLGVAEHCVTCPSYARNSPYLKSTLPGLPAEGFHVTQCGTNCRCQLEVNELSEAESRVFTV